MADRRLTDWRAGWLIDKLNGPNQEGVCSQLHATSHQAPVVHRRPGCVIGHAVLTPQPQLQHLHFRGDGERMRMKERVTIREKRKGEIKREESRK